jgi:hypothetical protein
VIPTTPVDLERIRVYTSNTTLEQRRQLSKTIPGYTVYMTNGWWEGEFEHSEVFELLTASDEEGELFIGFVVGFGQENGEQAIIVTREPAQLTSWFRQ